MKDFNKENLWKNILAIIYALFATWALVFSGSWFWMSIVGIVFVVYWVKVVLATNGRKKRQS